MRVFFLTGSGLSADSGLATFRGAGGLYQNMSAETFLSAEHYARDPESIEAWLDGLRETEAAASPNAAHAALARYQQQHPDTILLTQNVDTLLERAGANEVVHLHGRIDRLRCLGHAHALSLKGGRRSTAPERCPECGSRWRSDVVLFGEVAPAYATLHAVLEHATQRDVLVVIGSQGSVLPIEEFARHFPGFKVLNNLHASEWIDSKWFDHYIEAAAKDAAAAIIRLLESLRES